MGDDIVTDGLRLGVQLHNALVQDVILGLHISLLLVHPLRLKLSLTQRVLEHDFLLVELLLFALELGHARSQEFDLLLALIQLVGQILRVLMLFLGLVTDTADLGLDLKDLVVSLLDELFDGLKGLVTLLHAEQALLPVLQQRLLAHDDALDLDGGLLESVAGSGRFFFLGDELGLVERLLLIEALDFLVHRVDQHILLLLRFLEIANVFLGAVSCPTRNGNLALHDLIVFFDLLKGAVELVELLLGLQHALKLLISLFLLALVLSLEDLVLPLSFAAVALHNIVVVVRALKSGLHARQLVLHSVELHTGLFALLANLSHSFFALAQLQVHTLVLIRQLLSQGVLQTGHQGL